MLRLLWKEWVEIRLFLLGVLAAPVFSMLVLKDQYGFTLQVRGEFIHSENPSSHWIALLIIAIWAASRFPEEMKRGYFSMLWLPVRRERILDAKFLPGLIAVLLLPAWCVLMICLIAPHRFGGHPETAMLYPKALNLLGYFLIAYCLAFAVSLYSNLATGALFGFVGGLLLPSLLELHVTTPIWQWIEAIYIRPARAHGVRWHTPVMMTRWYLLLFLQGLCVFTIITGAFTSLQRSVTPSPKRRAVWGIGVSGSILTLAGVLFFAFVPRADESRWPSFSRYLLPSPDGQQVARLQSDEPSIRNMHVEVVNLKNGQRRTALRERFIDLLAWTPDSKSLFVQVFARQGARTRIVRIDENGRTIPIIALPPERMKDYYYSPAEYSRITPDGRYLVLTRYPKYVEGVDIWAVDLRTNTARVCAADVSRYPGVEWDLLSQKSLVLQSYDGSFSEVALDGSGEKRRWRVR